MQTKRRITMFKKILLFLFLALFSPNIQSQINTDQLMIMGRSALYFEDYVLAIQYFNQVIRLKPYIAEPYYLRGLAKFSLDDYKGAEEDCTLCIERNPFISNAYQIRGISRQNQENFDGAIDDYKKGLESNPENKTMLLNKAIAEIQSKKLTEAEQSLDHLIQLSPSFPNAYMSRSQLYLEKKDTVRALQDINKVIALDKYEPIAYAQRALLTAQYTQQYDSALIDMDYAIKLNPGFTALYINRAILKYYKNDLRGAMDDYNRVVEIDPQNAIARYNRGLLRAQVGDKNRAIDDFSEVLKSEPDNSFAIYNRAVLRFETGDYYGSIQDFTEVLKQYPTFSAGYYARSEAKRKMNDLKGGEADFKRAMALEEAARKRENRPLTAEADSARNGNEPKAEKTETESEEDRIRKESDKNIRKFNRLVVADNNDVRNTYKSEIKGRIQYRNVDVEPQPPFLLSYYDKIEEVKRHVNYVKALDDLNKTTYLKKKLVLTNSEVPLTSDLIKEHFSSIDQYTQQIEHSSNKLGAYFGRAIDYMLVQDMANALNDIDRVVELNENFSLGYFMRAVIRLRQIEAQNATEEQLQATTPSAISIRSLTQGEVKRHEEPVTNSSKIKMKSLQYDRVLKDYNKAIELDPQFSQAYFNRGNLYFFQKNYRAALADYDEAIRIDPYFGEAYFNRGLVLVLTGETRRGTADLSKAGELGVIAAYNLIKRLSD